MYTVVAQVREYADTKHDGGGIHHRGVQLAFLEELLSSPGGVGGSPAGADGAASRPEATRRVTEAVAADNGKLWSAGSFRSTGHAGSGAAAVRSHVS